LNKRLSLAILDLDHFKLLNDTYGHQAGDDCLVKVASVLTMFASRPGDICARYGGEEFALVWGDTLVDQAEELARGILKRIADLGIPNEKAPTGNRLTASIGIVSVAPRSGSKLIDVISIADGMLYEAKASGRNRVRAQCITEASSGRRR
jgi:diguanylate cyclase (GGDEF)-like protein